MVSVNEVLKLLNKQALVQVASSLAGTPARQLDNNISPITGPGYVILELAFIKVLDQIADLILNMILECPLDDQTLFYGVPDGTPKGTQVSTSVWLTESVDRGIRRTLHRHDYSTAIDYLIQRSMIPRYVVPEHENSPWVFVHVDLHNDNIIIDEEYNIKGIIDRDCNFAVPLQKAATFPKLLENVPGAAPPGLSETHAYLDFAADKRFFLSILAEKEMKWTNGTSITQLMGTSSERKFFETSHHRVPVQPEFVSRFCSRTRENVGAALKEVERFLDINPMFSASDEAIVRTVQMLEDLLH
ncbi:hypothetical protein BDV39DRAFT_201166 [Aspergillus sergii]|uniref:Aminoglycoside phosphotransferase domain-containing protein n=1 Tax=Aspergillus sergii TaxID=1034303 RepID=A0A5N6XGK8_9EURO|nr:hypothetical protein BDV39DRAFT_201166 [Aspergillus sergii]